MDQQLLLLIQQQGRIDHSHSIIVFGLMTSSMMLMVSPLLIREVTTLINNRFMKHLVKKFSTMPGLVSIVVYSPMARQALERVILW
jgi:hypothetical protein